jgi:hypothetical protein
VPERTPLPKPADLPPHKHSMCDRDVPVSGQRVRSPVSKHYPCGIPSHQDLQDLFPVAVARVLRDADAVLGERFITYEPDRDTEMFLVTIAPDVPRVPGFLRPLDGTGLGFSWDSDMTWPDMVVSAAKAFRRPSSRTRTTRAWRFHLVLSTPTTR